MQDKEWEALRRWVRLDRWGTISARASAVCYLACCAFDALFGHFVKAGVFLVFTLGAYALSRWHPPLIKITDDTDERS